MLKKTITYTDYNGNEVTDDFYFNLNKAELMEMELSARGGLENYIRSIIQTRENEKLVSIFKDIILKAYGRKSIDGMRFEKSENLRKEFEQTEAYSELFFELVTDPDAAGDFISGIIPKNLEEVVRKEMNKQKEKIVPINSMTVEANVEDNSSSK